MMSAVFAFKDIFVGLEDWLVHKVDWLEKSREIGYELTVVVPPELTATGPLNINAQLINGLTTFFNLIPKELKGCLGSNSPSL